MVLHFRAVARKSVATLPTLPIPGRPQMQMKLDSNIVSRVGVQL